MAQYEMGLRDYWRILRKRKLAVVLTCLVTGTLTWYLTEHVIQTPAQFQADCKVSVRAGEIVGQRTVKTVNVAQEADFAKGEDLLEKALFSIEYFPFYAIEPLAVLPSEPGRWKGRPEELADLFQALVPLARKNGSAALTDFIFLFKQQGPAANRTVGDILSVASKQAEALKELRSVAATRDEVLAQARTLETQAAALDATDPAAAETLRDQAGEVLRRYAEQARAVVKKADFLSDTLAPKEAVITQLQSRMTIEWDRPTSSFTISLIAGAPAVKTEEDKAQAAASHITETVAVIYQAYTEWEGRREIRAEADRIKSEIDDLTKQKADKANLRRTKQDAVEGDIVMDEYRDARQNLLDATAGVTRLERYGNQLAAYIKQRAEDQKRGVAPGPIPPPTGIDDANIEELYRSSTQLEKEKNDALALYQPDSHVVQLIEEKIARIAGALQQVVASSVTNANARKHQAETRFEAAKAKIEGPTGPQKIQRDIAVITQEISDLTTQITSLTERRGQLALFSDQGVKVDIIGRPGTAYEITRASTVAKTLVGALVGLILGVVVAVLWETFDLTIGTIEEVEQFLETRVLGVVPHIEADKVAAEIRRRNPDTEAETSDAELQQRAALVTLYDPKSVPAESFRHIRTALDFSRKQTGPEAKVFLITSATLYEGKTTVAANLAVAMAQKGKRTCLLECDLRRPQLHRLLGLGRRPGLHDIFIGKMTWREATKSLSDFILGQIGMEVTVSVPGLENLSVITCGAVPPNPVELLDSDETRRLFEELRAAFDIVIVDSPPVLPVADAAVLSPYTDGTVLVYRAGAAPRTVLGRAKMELESVNAKLLGVVLNDLRPAAGDLTSTYPYKGYARHAYAEHEEAAEPPRITSELDAELAADRVGESNEEQVTRKVDLLLSAGKAESAVETAYEALHEAPQALGIRLALARSYAAAGRTGEAQAELLHVLDLDPRNTAALQRLAEMALDAGLEREALRWTEELLEFDPQNAKVRAQVAELQARLGEGGQTETT